MGKFAYKIFFREIDLVFDFTKFCHVFSKFLTLIGTYLEEIYIISIPNDPSGSCRGSFQVSIAMIYLTITLKASLTPSPFFAEVLNHFGMKLYS